MEDNLKALDAGFLDEEEMARVRHIGKHIYGKKQRDARGCVTIRTIIYQVILRVCN
jgi:hypothetical protein